jgi:hypothetical protein
VNDEKRWAEVGRAMKLDAKTCTSLSNSIKTTYMRIILPFELYLLELGESSAEPADSIERNRQEMATAAKRQDHHWDVEEEKKEPVRRSGRQKKVKNYGSDFEEQVTEDESVRRSSRTTNKRPIVLPVAPPPIKALAIVAW